MLIALAGPTWQQRPVPIYQSVQPRVVLLDLSEDMLQQDLSPTRLARAKFKLHDLLLHPNPGQLGLLVYTGEPFMVSPLTQDAQTIESLLPSLSPAIMPIQGNRLDLALHEAQKMLNASLLQGGEVLVLTGKLPTSSAVDAARQLAKQHIHVSVIPLLADHLANTLFEPLARAGHGKVIPFSPQNHDIDQWLSQSHAKMAYQTDNLQDIPLWYDEGHWFLLLALILLLPIFRRGGLQQALS